MRDCLLAERYGAVDDFLRAVHFLGVFLVNRLRGGNEGILVRRVHLHAASLELAEKLSVVLGSLLVHERLRFLDRKSTRLNSSHGYISYAVFCLKKKKLNYLVKEQAF